MDTNRFVVKIGIIGDTQTGKRRIVDRYQNNSYTEDKWKDILRYDICEKTIALKSVSVTLSIWTISAKIKEDQVFQDVFTLVCQDAKSIIFTFDLTNPKSLHSIKQWYKNARQNNAVFTPMLVGTKYDLFHKLPFNDAYRSNITNKARYFAIKMCSPLIYCSALKTINVKKIFKLMVAKIFDLKSKLKEHHNEHKEALIEYENQFYYKASQKRIDTVLGYMRSFECKYSLRDIGDIILLYYGPNRKKTNQEVHKWKERRRKQKKKMKYFISGYMRSIESGKSNEIQIASNIVHTIIAYFTRKELKSYQKKKDNKHKKRKKKRKSSK